MSRRSVSDSRRLSWLLRHGAGEAALPMDAAGWAAIDDVCRVLTMSHSDLSEAVRRNDKQRLQVDGERIRACQGHSMDAMPVTREALEASWQAVGSDGSYWHGTSDSALPKILAEGILPGGRSHVHLAPSPSSTVGKRSSVDVLIEVSGPALAHDGHRVFRAPNGVLLVRYVPVEALRPVDGRSTI